MMHTGAYMGNCRPSITHDKLSNRPELDIYERYVMHSVSMESHVLRRSVPQGGCCMQRNRQSLQKMGKVECFRHTPKTMLCISRSAILSCRQRERAMSIMCILLVLLLWSTERAKVHL